MFMEETEIEGVTVESVPNPTLRRAGQKPSENDILPLLILLAFFDAVSRGRHF